MFINRVICGQHIEFLSLLFLAIRTKHSLQNVTNLVMVRKQRNLRNEIAIHQHYRATSNKHFRLYSVSLAFCLDLSEIKAKVNWLI